MAGQKGYRMEPFSFATSSVLDLPVNVRINTLDGHQKPIPYSILLKNAELRHLGSNTNPHFELYVTAQIWADSKPLTVPVQTAYKHFKTARIWNEWLSLPMPYSSLPLNAQLAITVWDLSPIGANDSQFHAIPFGGTTVPLFDKDNTLQKGRQRCRLHRHRAADGLSETSTPWILPPVRGRRGEKTKVETVDERVAEMVRLEALVKKHEMGEIPESKWLDQMVFRKIERLERSILTDTPRRQHDSNGSHTDRLQHADTTNNDQNDEEQFYLHIEFPRFDHPIVFTDTEYPAPPISSMLHSGGSNSEVRLKPPPEVSFGPGINVDGEAFGDGDSGRLIRIYDPEVGMRDNPAESKHRRLIRSHRTGALDRDLKPNAKIRDELNVIMAYGPTHELISDEKDLVWKFRHHLTRDKRALTKFVKSVAWNDQNEARQAVQMLPKWTEIAVDDALELLGPSFTNPAVRAYAVDRLKKSDDDELLVYLLQLVQALKYETIACDTEDSPENDSSLAQFLVTRAANNLMLGNYLHWYLMVECDDYSAEQGPEHRKLFAKVEFDFMTSLNNTPDGPQRRKTLLRQAEFITILTKASREIKTSREDRPGKIERLKKFLADPKNELLHIDPPIPLPLDPSISINGCFPEECSVFKSSMLPLQITLRTTTGAKYPIIFKTGDDLRQDQLVMQIITLMDRLLQKENLDLKLTPYRILATGAFAGALQFIPSSSIAGASAKYKGSLLNYLRANNPDETAPHGVRREAMDTYVKSCAGYCVITYLLGVGDRHLENLLLTPDGHFFHADFGYILGRDPKPFAPLMKLSKEMIDGMGGPQSQQYRQFREHCYTAYTTLRKSANLILNLFALMREANVPDIRIEPDKAVWKVQERMMLDLSEEEAIRHFEALILDSQGAMMPVVIDRLHGLVQHWRA
ncbi:phosphoinositide 3-kinase [Pseudovirgaria hyperparasitica]|uniref:Phosphatidylinositol 3-kinase VPS34 n=1 Tax=Pseudovirgaria hyperparasitica TaxID=470096 RepID=A0A6A6WN09_9PEZI|nr:phosphoinositide 3-kinase [Pseudovirgaria hyperparasitica]KAF2763513.1 phosphoinositide 3-kinase [Pseudovirgaria hyperparasitica]